MMPHFAFILSPFDTNPTLRESVSIFILYLILSAESAGFPTSCYILVDPAVYFRTGQMQACDIDPIIHVVFRTM